jgi:hypothetical protein
MLHDRIINVRPIFRNFYIIIIIIIIIIILIIAIDLITLLSIYVLGNLSQIFGGIRLSQVRKFILSPKVNESVLGICVLYDTFLIFLIFCPTLKMFLFKHTISRPFSKFVFTAPSAGTTKGYTDMLWVFQKFFIYTVKLLYFVIFSASVWEGNSYI